MRSLLLTVLLLCGGLTMGFAASARAQTLPDRAIESVPPGRISLSPFIGWRAPIAQDRQEVLVVPGEFRSLAVQVESRHVGQGIAGLEAELRLAGAVGLSAALAFSNPENRILTAETPRGNVTQVSLRGPSLWFARAGISLRMPEPTPDTRKSHPAAYLIFGPAVVREVYGEDGTLSLGTDNDHVDSWALHLGARGVVPLGMPGVFVLLAAENYATLWNVDDPERARLERAIQLQPGTLLNSSLGANRTHVIAASIGLSFRI